MKMFYFSGGEGGVPIWVLFKMFIFVVKYFSVYYLYYLFWLYVEFVLWFYFGFLWKISRSAVFFFVLFCFLGARKKGGGPKAPVSSNI